MAQLKRYPSLETVRELTSPEDLAAGVKNIASYNRKEILATFALNVLDTGLLRAWLDFYDKVHKIHPDAVLTRDWNITRDKSPAELEEHVLSTLASTRFYNPEDARWADQYTEDDINYDK